MLLAVDVGNTNIVWGVYRSRELAFHWRTTTGRQATADEFGMLLHQLCAFHGLGLAALRACAVASVVPPLTPAIEEMARRYLGVEALVVGPGVRTGMDVRYENPREVGADRIVNAVAAFELYGGPCIVVDLGTATTFDVVSARGEYLGGAIAPGIGISTEALFERAARLPRIELVRPRSAIGKNTVASMQAGIVLGFAGMIDSLVSRIKRELGGDARVVATGGLADLVAQEARTVEVVNPLLTLEGLRLVYERNLPREEEQGEAEERMKPTVP
ncbi:MAG: type III pantothenate kinase [Bacillota bacterium]|nr:type III pantothenate kinase [Bacillota bacterium]MDI7250057.1 type III pantothenate kinase [Bacillota bacterium]